MKLIIREYLSSLREREELDAILPDLLSELGFTVYSRPRRGTVQHGVDIAAVGPINGGSRKVYLFSVKKGDLSRSDWNTGVQALRPSLDAIQDVYIPARIPKEYSDLKVVICLCFGGDLHEQIRAEVDGYKARYTTDRLSFEEWNGDRIAGYLLQGLLKEDILPRPLRASFRKAVALLDEPDVAYRHFADLMRQLRGVATESDRSRVRAARQIYVAVWVMFVWARDLENLEAAYTSSELSVLTVWEILKPLIDNGGSANEDISRVLHQLIQVHLTIASEFIGAKIAPHVGVRDALSTAVRSRAPTDVNLKLFELLGRMAMCGLWTRWLHNRDGQAGSGNEQEAVSAWLGLILTMIENNAALRLPIADQQSTDIVLALLFWLVSGTAEHERVFSWLDSMVSRLDFTIRARSRFTICSNDYRDMIRHPQSRSDSYVEEQTIGSTLIPTLTAWLAAMGATSVVETLSNLVEEKLGHSTMQFWIPDEDSEEAIYTNASSHGRALCGLPITPNGKDLIDLVGKECDIKNPLANLSAVKTGFEPIVLMACRHWRLPVPPAFYIESLRSSIDRLYGESTDGTG